MKFCKNKEHFIKEINSAEELCAHGLSLKNCTFQNIDFTKISIPWEKYNIDNTIFLGCKLIEKDEITLRKSGAFLYPSPKGIPYNPFRRFLYQWEELLADFRPGKKESYDLHIYNHIKKDRFNPPINEALWQRIHDHAMDDGIRDLLQFDEQGMTEKKCVGIMGGHSTLRTDAFFEKTAFTAWYLANAGYFIVSGGGPGIMEAANLGAYFSGYGKKDLRKAIKILAKAPHYSHKNFHKQALKVLEKFPEGKSSLAIPTWFYGHEPSNLFASHIAKYFSNSIREDTLLAVSLYGLICAPGSAGTTQEIFMDAAQNHYGTFNYYSPMIFLGKEHYEIRTLIYPLLRQLSFGKTYHELMMITDKPKEVLTFLKKHPPVKVKKA